jgi:intein-encoded DNA endonuclease-like protein
MTKHSDNNPKKKIAFMYPRPLRKRWNKVKHHVTIHERKKVIRAVKSLMVILPVVSTQVERVVMTSRAILQLVSIHDGHHDGREAGWCVSPP